jgi:hypothetical protein
MTHSEFIAKQVYDQCIAINCSELQARESAQSAVKQFHMGNYSETPAKLIKEAVTAASKFKQKKVNKSWR